MWSVSNPDVGVNQNGQQVRFGLFDLPKPTTFTYTVTASSVADDYTFNGFLRDSNQDDHPLDDSPITVEAGAQPTPEPSPEPTPEPAPTVVPGGPGAARSLSVTTVEPGGEVEVTITADDYGSFASVVETLPDGFSYVSVSNPDVGVNQNGQQVRFGLFDLPKPTTFTYTVTASSVADDYTFKGFLRDSNQDDHPLD